MSYKPGDLSSVQSQTEHRQAPHAPHGASPAPGCPSWPSPTNSGHVPLCHMPPPWRQHGPCLVESCRCPHGRAHQQRGNTASSGFKWGVRALGGSQPLLDTHQPVEFAFQARHVCSELSELKVQTQRASLKVPCGVWPAPCPQGTRLSWQDTRTLLLCLSPEPMRAFSQDTSLVKCQRWQFSGIWDNRSLSHKHFAKG